MIDPLPKYLYFDFGDEERRNIPDIIGYRGALNVTGPIPRDENIDRAFWGCYKMNDRENTWIVVSEYVVDVEVGLFSGYPKIKVISINPRFVREIDSAELAQFTLNPDSPLPPPRISIYNHNAGMVAITIVHPHISGVYAGHRKNNVGLRNYQIMDSESAINHLTEYPQLKERMGEILDFIKLGCFRGDRRTQIYELELSPQKRTDILTLSIVHLP